MLERFNSMLSRDAIFGGDAEEYRYVLSRPVDDEPIDGINILWVMVNPSVATAVDNDHTITKCHGFSQIYGARQYRVVNLCAFRAQDVKELKRTTMDVVGPHNDFYIGHAAAWADIVVCAWGRRTKLPSKLKSRPEEVVKILKRATPKLYCLGTTKDGDPVHPLMISYTTELTEYAA